MTGENLYNVCLYMIQFVRLILISSRQLLLMPVIPIEGFQLVLFPHLNFPRIYRKCSAPFAALKKDH